MKSRLFSIVFAFLYLNSSCLGMVMNGVGTVVGWPLAYTERKLVEGGIMDCETGSDEDRETLGGDVMLVFTMVGLIADVVYLIIPPISCIYYTGYQASDNDIHAKVWTYAKEKASSWKATGSSCVDQELVESIEKERAERELLERIESNRGPVPATHSGPIYDPGHPERKPEYSFPANILEMPESQYPEQRSAYCVQRFRPVLRQIFLRNMKETERVEIETVEECRFDRNRSQCKCSIQVLIQE